jgi:hypothetical protein
VYVRDFTRNLFEIGEEERQEEPVVEVDSGDMFLSLNLKYWLLHTNIRKKFDLWHERGVFLTASVHDLPPWRNPE